MNRFWPLLTRAIAARPNLILWLIERATGTPYFHVHGPDDTLYIGRWWLLPRWALMEHPTTGTLEPKSWHRRAWRLVPSVRLHLIARPDVDRHLHDHPADFRSLVIKGWYREEDIFGRVRTVTAGDTYASRAERFHRIAEVPEHGVWTIFILGPKRHKWGFLVEGRKVPWEQYLSGNTTEAGS